MAKVLELDGSIPFVRAVLDAILDHGKMDSAVAVLLAAEHRHGVRVIFDPVCGSLAATCIPGPSAPATVGELLALLRRAPVELGNAQAWESFGETLDAHYQGGPDDAFDAAALFGFLDETSMILAATDFANDHWIVTRGGVLSSWTQRAWGAQLERWPRWIPSVTDNAAHGQSSASLRFTHR